MGIWPRHLTSNGPILSRLGGVRFFSRSIKELIALIPGDGIGKEVIPAAHRVLEKAAPGRFAYEYMDAGFECFLEKGNALPKETLEALETKCMGCLFGATQSPISPVSGYSSPILQLRNKFNLYANVRPITIPAKGKSPPVDIVIVREGTECVYIKREWEETDPDGLKVAWALRKISQAQSMKVGRYALDLALKRSEESRNLNKSPMVTVVHKSNVLGISDGLFRTSVKKVHESDSKYAGVKIVDQIVDSMLYKLVIDPSHFDVVVCPNLYGDLISDCGAALMGSLGVAASANVGDTFVLCEPVHGSAPDIAGMGISNPIASIRSAALLMETLGEVKIAKKINTAVNKFLTSGAPATPDLNGNKTTVEVTDAICSYLDTASDNS